MLSRRSFFAAAAGAVAGAAGVASAAPVRGAEARFARMQEIFKDIRGQLLPPWPYPPIREAANLPVIGKDSLPKETPAQRAQRLACEKPPSPRETGEQYRKRVGRKCPGALE